MFKKYSELQQQPTEEMIAWFNKRTAYHIELVQNFAKALQTRHPGLLIQAEGHDANKYVEPLRTPYVFNYWKYRQPDYKYPKGMQDRIHEVTLIHVTTNKHHPEYWNPEGAEISENDRDANPEKPLDVSEMPESVIGEMIADWSAISVERHEKTPRTWADKTVGPRWQFSDKQINLIYILIDSIEEILAENPDFVKIKRVLDKIP